MATHDTLVDDSISTKMHAHTLIDKKPLGDSARITQGLGGCTRGCACVHPLTKQNFPHRQHENPPDDSTRIAPGLGGYNHGCTHAHPL